MIKDDKKTFSEADGDNAVKKTFRETAEAAEAENREAAEDIGKFESVGALLAAYKSLEAEFTRRSQRLKELEEGRKAHAVDGEAPSSESVTVIDEDVRNAVISEYLKTVASGKSVPLIVGGVGSAAPKFAPKTVREAGALAERFLKN